MSFYNESFGQPIYPTPTVGLVGLLDDVTKHCTLAFKDEGDVIVLLGETAAELGGSEYLKVEHGMVAGRAARARPRARARRAGGVMREAIGARHHQERARLLGGRHRGRARRELHRRRHRRRRRTSHDDLHPVASLFGETQSRIVVTVADDDAEKLVDDAARRTRCPYSVIGTVGGERLVDREQARSSTSTRCALRTSPRSSVSCTAKRRSRPRSCTRGSGDGDEEGAMTSRTRFANVVAICAVVALLPLFAAGTASAAPAKVFPQRLASTDLPGDPLTSPFSGMINRSSTTSWCQVYSIELQAGERFTVRLNANAPEGIAMGLLPPGTVNVFSEFVAGSDNPLYPQMLQYQAPVAGTYSLVVGARSVAPPYYWMSYEGEYWVTAGDSQSNIPGQPLTVGGEDTGTHESITDWNDVYSVTLAVGEALHLRLNNRSALPTPGDVDLYVFGPGASSVYTSSPLAGSQQRPQVEDTILYRARAGGEHYVSTWSFGSAVDYTLESTVTPSTSVSCFVSKTSIPFGGLVSISGLLTENSQPLSDESVWVQAYTGAAYKSVAHSKAAGPSTWPVNVSATGAPYDSGTFKVTLARQVNARFRTAYSGSFFKHSPSESTYKDVYVKAWLPTPSAPTAVNHRRAFAVSGLLKPRHAAGSYPVLLRFERWERGSGWVLRKTVKARAYNYLSYTKYRASVALPYTGSWRVRAYHSGDSIIATNGNAATYSAYRAVTVR